MKFAHNFQDSLEEEHFPQDWVESAIAYRKLKKCIKKIQRELEELGLDRPALKALWQPMESTGKSEEADTGSAPEARPIQYTFTSGDSMDLMPKLTIALDQDGSPMDAWLSADTRLNLRRLVEDQQMRRRRSIQTLDGSDSSHSVPLDQSSVDSCTRLHCPEPTSGEEVHKGNGETEFIEIPLTYDLEFFHDLRRQLIILERLQKKEQENMNSQIVKLGQNLREMKSSHSKKSRANIEMWREIFRQYLDSQIFFSSNEQDAGVRDAKHAQTQLQLFKQALETDHRLPLTPNKSVGDTVDRFLRINRNLLLLVKYQELNRTAVSKILKKFNKQTALRSQANESPWLTTAPVLAQDLAKATCCLISEELLQIIPQIDDYLCPICFSISYKPIRLRCHHVFCIRCLIVMQRAQKDHCPLCRREVVMEASSCKTASFSYYVSC
jgi:E3 ubiquitin-protein ligase BAH